MIAAQAVGPNVKGMAMRISQTLLVAAALLCPFSLEAGSARSGEWNLSPCTAAESAAAREAGGVGAREYSHEDPNWIPHPFSRVPSEIAANAMLLHRRAFADTPDSSLATGDQRLFSLDRDGRLRTEVEMVSDWTPGRCDPRVRSETGFWLVRFFDRTTEREITRIVLRPEGSIARLRHASNGYSFPDLPSLAAIAEFGESEIPGLERNSGQFVTVWGPRECSPVTPCVAWKVGSGAVVRMDDSWILVEPNAQRFSFRDDLRGENRWSTANSLNLAGQRLISLGGDLWVAGRLIEPGSRSR